MATTTATQTTTDDTLDPTRWTTPQELVLLQSIIHTKPIGLHKHFRMLNILEALLGSGTIPLPVSSHPHCSTTEGIWRKLGSLYDLKALDEREDAVFADLTPEADEDAESGNDEVVEYWREFELPGGDFEQAMWDRRLAEREEHWSDDDVRMRESTVADSEDPRSSPVGSVRGTRSSGRRAAGRRLAEVKQADSPAAGSVKASTRASKAASPSVKDEEDTEMHDADQEDDEGSDEEEESDQNETEDDSRKGRFTRGRGGRRGRGRRGRRGK